MTVHDIFEDFNIFSMFKNQPQPGNQPRVGFGVTFLYKLNGIEHIVSGRITAVSHNTICAVDSNGKDYMITRDRILKVNDEETADDRHDAHDHDLV